MKAHRCLPIVNWRVHVVIHRIHASYILSPPQIPVRKSAVIYAHKKHKYLRCKNLRQIFNFHPLDESTSAEDDLRSGLPCLLVTCAWPLSARQLIIFSESLITGVNVMTLVVTFPSELV